MERWIKLDMFSDIDIFNVTTIVYLLLLNHYDFEFNQVVYNRGRAGEWCNLAGIPISSFDRGMKELKEKGIICNDGGKITIPKLEELQKHGKTPIIWKR